MTWNQHRANEALSAEGTDPGFADGASPFQRWRTNVFQQLNRDNPIVTIEPVVYGNKVFHGGLDHVVSVDADNGETVFDVDLGERTSLTSMDMASTLAVDPDGVYVLGTGSGACEVFRLNRSDGSVEWQTRFDFPALSNLVLDGDSDKLFFGGGSPGSEGHLVCLETSGSVAWQKNPSNPPAMAACTSNRLVTSAVDLGTVESIVAGYSKGTGSESFSGTFDVTDPYIAVGSEELFLVGRVIGGGPAIHKVNMSDGSSIWSMENEIPVAGVAVERFLFVAFRQNRNVVAIDKGSGGVSWQSPEVQVEYGPSVFGDSVIVTDGNSVYSYSADSGELNRSYEPDGTVKSIIACSASDSFFIVDSDLVNYGTETPDPIDGYNPSGREGIIYIVVQYIGPNNYEIHDKGTISGESDTETYSSEFIGWAELNVENVDTGSKILEGRERPYYPGQKKMFALADAAKTQDEAGESADTSLSNNSVEWSLNISECHELSRFRVSYGCVLESDHTHKMRPGIQEQFESRDPEDDSMTSFYPEKARIFVNGEDMGQVNLAEDPDNIGVKEIFGKLEEGSVNNILVRTSGLGHMQVWVEGDVYRRIMGRG